MRAKVIALAACLVALPAFAWADDGAVSQPANAASSSEVVTTAVPQAAPPTGAAATPAPANNSSVIRWLQEAPPVSLGDDYQSGVIQPATDRGIHGEMGFGVGSNGYRDAYATATMPVGKTGELGVAVDDTQYGKPYRFNQRTLAVNLALGSGAGGPPVDCSSAIRVGDHYVEPLWATRIRGSALQDGDPRCISAGPPPR